LTTYSGGPPDWVMLPERRCNNHEGDHSQHGCQCLYQTTHHGGVFDIEWLEWPVWYRDNHHAVAIAAWRVRACCCWASITLLDTGGAPAQWTSFVLGLKGQVRCMQSHLAWILGICRMHVGPSSAASLRHSGHGGVHLEPVEMAFTLYIPGISPPYDHAGEIAFII
jgi:hypothetical protein